MQRIVRLIGPLVLALALSSDLYADEGWNIQTVTIGEPFSVSMDLDANDKPHITFLHVVDPVFHAVDVKFAKEVSPVGWDIEAADTGIYNSGFSTTLFDGYGFAHLAYTLFSGSDIVKYAFNDGQAWYPQRVDSDAQAGAMALDAKGYPHLVFSSRQGLKYAFWNGSSWHIELVSPGFSHMSRLQLDSKGNPHIIFNAIYPPRGSSIKYARKNGEEWEIEIVDFGEVAGHRGTLTIDSQDVLHMAYYFPNSDRSGDLKYAVRLEKGWSLSFVDQDGVFCGIGNSIAIDSKGNPHIAYFAKRRGSEYTQVEYAKWVGDYWQRETVDLAGGYINTMDIALNLDSNDDAHISYASLVPTPRLKYAKHYSS